MSGPLIAEAVHLHLPRWHPHPARLALWRRDPHRALWLVAAWLVAAVYILAGLYRAFRNGRVPDAVNFYIIAQIPNGIRWHGIISLAIGCAVAFTLRLLAHGMPFCRTRIAVLWAAEIYALFIALSMIGSWYLTRRSGAVTSPLLAFLIAALAHAVRAYPPLAKPRGGPRA